MSLASRGTRAAARTIRQTRVPRQPRRNASSGGHGHEHDHPPSHGESALHLPSANPQGNESMGKGIYITLTAVPIFYLGYSLATGGDDNYFGRLYQQFKDGKKATIDADALHTAVMSQAISDRARLSSYPRETTGPNLMNAESIFNTGSPYNQAVGQSRADLRDLAAYYEKVNAAQEEERIVRQNEGKRSVYD